MRLVCNTFYVTRLLRLALQIYEEAPGRVNRVVAREYQLPLHSYIYPALKIIYVTQ